MVCKGEPAEEHRCEKGIAEDGVNYGVTLLSERQSSYSHIKLGAFASFVSILLPFVKLILQPKLILV